MSLEPINRALVAKQSNPSEYFTTREAILFVLRQLLAELGSLDATTRPITEETTFDRDLGFDSLARAELFSRVERLLGVKLRESSLAEADTIRDLSQCIENTQVAVSERQTVKQQLATKMRLPLEPIPTIEVSIPAGCSTIQEVLLHRAQQHGNSPGIHLLMDGQSDQVITYSDLSTKATELASKLRSRGFQPRSTIALMLPTGVEYFTAFMGVLLAGCIPVPLYPPTRLSQVREHLQRHIKILESSSAELIIIDQRLSGLADFLKRDVRSLKSISSLAELREGRDLKLDLATNMTGKASETAFVQYTSGSTGDPKGVILTHENLLANIQAIGTALVVRQGDVFASWLPLYHDMGLIGAWLGTLYYGIPLVIMPPLTFLNRPEKWLWAMHNYRATLTAAPNFAYEICARRIQDKDIVGLKLNSMRVAMNGSEPVSPDTIARFSARFAPYGFRPNVMLPVYGLAESSVGLTFPPLERGPLIDSINREEFSRFGRAVPARRDDTTALRLVSCGLPLAGHELRIIDKAGRKLPDRCEGTIEFRGPSATAGYLNRPEATSKLINNGWLNTGDRGYLAASEIYITGRVKDMIIRGGQNIYPHELEETIGDIAGIRKGCVVAFGVPDKNSGTEQLIAIAETRETDSQKKSQLVQRIQKALVDLTGDPADDIVLVPPHTVLKTSSGKIRRSACREQFVTGKLSATTHQSPWRQLLALYGGKLGYKAMNILAALSSSMRSTLAWMIAFVAVILGLLVLACPLSNNIRWRIISRISNAGFRLMGVSIAVQQDENISQAPPGSILIANHQSYLDAFVLMSILPSPVRFVAKDELSHNPMLKIVLQRLGVIFVERFDPNKGVQDTRKLVEAAALDQTLMIFPEGTFTGSAHLLPFHLGAFLTAAETQHLIIPLIIQGTRSILPPESWLIHPGRVIVRAESAIDPKTFKTDDRPAAHWELAIKLRDTAQGNIGSMHA